MRSAAFDAGLAPAFEVDRARAAGLGQPLAVVVAHGRDALGRNRPLHQLERVDQRCFQDAPHALGLAAVQKIVAREEARPRIGQRAAQRMRAGQHPLVPSGSAAPRIRPGWRLISCAAHSKGQPQDALRLASGFHRPAGTKRPAGARDGARLAASGDDRDPDPPAGRKGPGGAVRERRAGRRHALRHPGAGQPLRHGRARGLGHGPRARPAARGRRDAGLPAPARAAGRLARGARHAAHAAHRDGDEAQDGGQRARARRSC